MKKLLLLLCLPMIGFGQSASAYCNKAQENIKNQEFSQAIINYSYAIEMDEDFTKAYAGRGDAYHLIEDYYKAVYDFIIVIEQDPSSHYGYFKRGLAKYEIGDYQGALKDYSKALELNPSSNNEIALYHNRADVLMELKLPYCEDLRKLDALKGYKSSGRIFFPDCFPE